MFNTAPTFKKIDLLLKLGGTKKFDNNDSLRDFDIERTTKISIENCSMVITGDYVIISEENNNDGIISSKIYNLEEIDSYRIHR